MMQSYIEIKVPLRSDARWIKELKQVFRDAAIRVAWKIPGHPHLTLAFIDETPNVGALARELSPYISKATALTIKFDRLNVFRAQSGTKYVVNLTTSAVPERFQCLVNNVRDVLKQNGAEVKSEFLFHVTLGEIDNMEIDIAEIQGFLNTVALPEFSLPLRDVRFLEFRGNRRVFAEWTIR